jgi:FtsP/CotA-like multicopper oxidase with cupredoxin domain
MISRRNFLRTASLAGVGVMLPLGLRAIETTSAQTIGVVASGLSKFTEQLPIPPRILATSTGNYSRTLRPGTHSFHSQLRPTPTWGYGSTSYLGPTIEARKGVPITVVDTNQLGNHPLAYAIDTTLHGVTNQDKTQPRTSTHLHGGNTAAGSDGAPEQTFRPGGRYRYDYNNRQDAATLWYHDHAIGITRLNVYAGLAGVYLLRDQADTGLADNPLKLPAGPYEVPLIIQDKMFNTDGTLAYPPGAGAIWSPEFFGDVAVVNGKVWPNHQVDRGLYRFRIVNGSNARFYNLRLASNATVPMYQIGTDGGFLNAPVPIAQLLIAPGERADILLDFSRLRAGDRVVVTNNAVTPYPNGPRSLRQGGSPIKEIMQFTVTSKTGFQGPIPQRLRATPIPTLTPSKVRNVSIVEVMGMLQPLMGMLNNLHWTTSNIESPTVDTVEQWNIINTTGDTHPIHLHLVQFLVLGRQQYDVTKYVQSVPQYVGLPGTMGQGPWPVPSAEAFVKGPLVRPAANEQGWKDTVQANPGEITRILVPFGAGAAPNLAIGNSFTGDFVWHCHLLEHEDHDMMLPLRIRR